MTWIIQVKNDTKNMNVYEHMTIDKIIRMNGEGKTMLIEMDFPYCRIDIFVIESS